ncbi:MAG TPA: hypothetical protein VE954_23690 [Oligoflexus sp.]|uniref:hypothetical protein n=1 Tax=Oligoflexus sp. TaxID=1971216 RepID=UPI002D6F0861|nr:hypothetical protein [Oligoflexus sp.]HYX36115.1 hypothetical protein [Oligoflexus sp.]
MKQLLFIMFFLSSFSSCKCQKADQSEADDGASANESVALTPAVMRLTPEQISKQIKQALDFDIGWTDPDGRFHDLLIEAYGVPLGGIDFVSTHKRDPIPKVQTLLLVRRIAYDVASAVVWREAKPDATGPILFQHCSVTEDYPGEDADKDNRWMTQLEDFYWRFYSRPPTEAEKTLVRATAIDIMQREKWPPTVWTLTLYALLSSQEFWTI